MYSTNCEKQTLISTKSDAIKILYVIIVLYDVTLISINL